MIKDTRRKPTSAIGAWLLAALTGNREEGRRQLAAIQARIGARQFFPAEFIVVRVVFEALVQEYLAADAEPAAVNGVAREASEMVDGDAAVVFGWAAPELIATAAVIRRAIGDRPQPRYLGFGDEIDSIWTSVSLALVGRHTPRTSRIREWILEAEHTAAEWKPSVALTPAAP